MIAPGNSIVQIILGLAFLIASGYALGRIHQWYRYGNERDQSYREGYDEAAQSMFDMAVSTRVGANAADTSALISHVIAATPVITIRAPRSQRPNQKPTMAKARPAPSGPAPTTVGITRRRIIATAAHVSAQRHRRAAI
jgi:hypothetical protein